MGMKKNLKDLQVVSLCISSLELISTNKKGEHLMTIFFFEGVHHSYLDFHGTKIKNYKILIRGILSKKSNNQNSW